MQLKKHTNKNQTKLNYIGNKKPTTYTFRIFNLDEWRGSRHKKLYYQNNISIDV